MYNVVVFEGRSNSIMQVVNFNNREEANFYMDYLDENENTKAQMYEGVDTEQVLSDAKEHASDELRRAYGMSEPLQKKICLIANALEEEIRVRPLGAHEKKMLDGAVVMLREAQEAVENYL